MNSTIKAQPTDRHTTVFVGCDHPNYGTDTNYATVQMGCDTCGRFYCNYCNFDMHVCGGCGTNHSHGTDPHPGYDCTA